MSLARLMILLTALVFAAYGVGFIVAPLTMLEWATGAVVNTPSAIIDLRATYGGLSLAVGLVLYGLGRSQGGTPLGLRVVIELMLGMGGGRLVGVTALGVEFGGEAVVLVPACVHDLDETYAPFGQTTSHQAVVSERTAFRYLGTVHVQNVCRLLRDVG